VNRETGAGEEKVRGDGGRSEGGKRVGKQGPANQTKGRAREGRGP